MNMMYYILHINTSNISNSKNFVSLQTNGSCLCLPTCSLSHAPSCTFFFKLVSYFIYSFFEGNALHFFFLFYFILLYNTILVLPYINMNPPRVYMSSQSWTHLPPPSPYHLSGSSQCTRPKHPVSYIEPRLAIRFLHDIHVSMPFSQVIPSFPSPRVQKSVWYICDSFAVSHTGLSLSSF